MIRVKLVRTSDAGKLLRLVSKLIFLRGMCYLLRIKTKTITTTSPVNNHNNFEDFSSPPGQNTIHKQNIFEMVSVHRKHDVKYVIVYIRFHTVHHEKFNVCLKHVSSTS